MDNLNEIAMDLVKLLFIITICMVLTMLVIVILNRIIKIPKVITDFILGLSALAGAYMWFQVTFM